MIDVMKIAEAIVALINSQMRSPTQQEIEAVLEKHLVADPNVPTTGQSPAGWYGMIVNKATTGNSTLPPPADCGNTVFSIWPKPDDDHYLTFSADDADGKGDFAAFGSPSVKVTMVDPAMLASPDAWYFMTDPEPFSDKITVVGTPKHDHDDLVDAALNVVGQSWSSWSGDPTTGHCTQEEFRAEVSRLLLPLPVSPVSTLVMELVAQIKAEMDKLTETQSGVSDLVRGEDALGDWNALDDWKRVFKAKE